MKFLAIVCILIGVVYSAMNASDEYRGKTTTETPTVSPSMPQVYDKDEAPEAFRHAVNYNWYWSSALLALGIITLLFIRKADRMDPLSPDNDFDGDGDASRK